MNVLPLCSSLEMAANHRADVTTARVRPFFSAESVVIVEIRTGDGTAERSIETNLGQLTDGRTFRQILDAWLGPEIGERSKAPMLDTLPPCPQHQ